MNEYKCHECGEMHKDRPAIGCLYPDPYINHAPGRIDAKVNDDLCVIIYEDQIDRFVRCVMEIEIQDTHEKLPYGVWVSLSEKNFMEYADKNMDEDYHAHYSGFFSNTLPEYPDNNTLTIPMMMVVNGGGQRPIVYPHPDYPHQLVKDYYDGITEEEADKRVAFMMDNLKKMRGEEKN